MILNLIQTIEVQDYVRELVELCESEMAAAIAEIENQRFLHQGNFNDNKSWANNANDVVQDKGFNAPLEDTGFLKNQLTNKSNWAKELFVEVGSKQTYNKEIKQVFGMQFSDNESFTLPKYNILQTGGKGKAYISPRGKAMKARDIPARNFKEFSDMDMEWIVDYITKKLEGLQ